MSIIVSTLGERILHSDCNGVSNPYQYIYSYVELILDSQSSIEFAGV